MNYFISVLRLIKKTDIFGQTVKLKINDEIRSKTILGGVLTIITIIILSILLVLQFQDLLNHTSPKIFIETQNKENSDQIVLNKNTFPISFVTITEANENVDLPRFFEFEVLYTRLSISENYTEFLHYNFSKCITDDFPQISKKLFNDLYINEANCINDQNISLSGSYSEDHINYLVISLILCKNTTTNNCAPHDEIKEYLKHMTVYLSVTFQNTLINPQNYLEPIKYSFYTYYQ